MSGVDRVVHLLSSTGGSAIRPGTPADDAILELLVHMASSDGVFDDSEIEMLETVLPTWNATQIRAFIGKVSATEFDLDAFAAAMTDDDQRWTALRFAARMAYRDAHLDDAERTFLEDLAGRLGLPDGALERVLTESVGLPPELLAPDALRTLVEAYPWESVDFADGAVQSADLLAVVPQGVTPILRVGVDAAEVMGIYAEGIVVRFGEGPAFLPWRTIVGFSRGTGLDTAVRIHTEDGRYWSIVDTRMSGIERVIDRLYRRAMKLRPGPPPEVVATVSRDDTWDGDPA
ncbi:MAG: TerB family tellurite resistance protein [Alphaproteobacteria bacterium]|nr:TerB family tellurite resistance protein [Alphaproteobacteria bacterium]